MEKLNESLLICTKIYGSSEVSNHVIHKINEIIDFLNKKDNPVPSIDDINNVLHNHRDSFIGLDSFRRLQKDIIELYQNGRTTDKEQPNYNFKELFDSEDFEFEPDSISAKQFKIKILFSNKKKITLKSNGTFTIE